MGIKAISKAHESRQIRKKSLELRSYGNPFLTKLLVFRIAPKLQLESQLVVGNLLHFISNQSVCVIDTYLYGTCTVPQISKSSFLMFKGVSLHYLGIAFRVKNLTYSCKIQSALLLEAHPWSRLPLSWHTRLGKLCYRWHRLPHLTCFQGMAHGRGRTDLCQP